MEQWKDITGFEGIYQVSDYGRIKALSRVETFPCMFNGTKTGIRKEIILKPRLHSNGYHRVGLGFGKRRDYYVHRLVAQAFHDNKAGKPEVNHKNGIKSDNRAINLEWATRGENSRHAVRTGLFRHHGIRVPTSKLDVTQVKTIRSIGKSININDMCRYFNVSYTCIRSILSGKTWTHI